MSSGGLAAGAAEREGGMAHKKEKRPPKKRASIESDATYEVHLGISRYFLVRIPPGWRRSLLPRLFFDEANRK